MGPDEDKYHPRREFISKDGMSRFKEIAYYKDKKLPPIQDRFFDVFATYAPFPWLGSRRLTKEELDFYGLD